MACNETTGSKKGAIEEEAEEEKEEEDVYGSAPPPLPLPCRAFPDPSPTGKEEGPVREGEKRTPRAVSSIPSRLLPLSYASSLSFAFVDFWVRFFFFPPPAVPSAHHTLLDSMARRWACLSSSFWPSEDVEADEVVGSVEPMGSLVEGDG